MTRWCSAFQNISYALRSMACSFQLSYLRPAPLLHIWSFSVSPCYYLALRGGGDLCFGLCVHMCTRCHKTAGARIVLTTKI